MHDSDVHDVRDELAQQVQLQRTAASEVLHPLVASLQHITRIHQQFVAEARHLQPFRKHFLRAVRGRKQKTRTRLMRRKNTERARGGESEGGRETGREREGERGGERRRQGGT